MAGTYYLYDSIAPVADLLVSHLGFKDTDIGKLYPFINGHACLPLLF